MSDAPLLTIAIVFAPLSLAAFGGGLSILPALQHQAVDVHQWVSARQFVEIFAVARTAPGPGSMLVTLLGWQVAGWSGALVASLAMFLPSSILCLVATQLWARHEGKAWHSVIQEGIAPIGPGLMGGGIIALTRLADTGPASWITGALSVGLLVLRPRTSPVLVLFAAGGAFVLASLLGQYSRN